MTSKETKEYMAKAEVHQLFEVSLYKLFISVVDSVSVQCLSVFF